MAKITYIQTDGTSVEVDASDGSLMTAAVANQVAGVEGECGGVCSCATCHLHIDADWVEKVGPSNDAEAAMLELDDAFADNSRLGCQVPITDGLDGLTVRVAE
ncbi:MAG: 2Fe-2S iron-sulfur cluster-binding protein [Planctomycetota bacterium]